MSKCRIVAGALIEGDGEDAADGNAGTWIQLVLMLEEVTLGGRMLTALVVSPQPDLLRLVSMSLISASHCSTSMALRWTVT